MGFSENLSNFNRRYFNRGILIAHESSIRVGQILRRSRKFLAKFMKNLKPVCFHRIDNNRIASRILF